MGPRVRYVPPIGNKNAYVMIVGEAPGAEEEEAGRPFVGESGKLLDEALQLIKWDKKDIYITNVVKVRPPNNRAPTLDESETWKPVLFQEIKDVNPFLVIALGAVALRTFNDSMRISRDQGKIVNMYVNESAIMLAPIFHPAYVIRGYHDRQKWLDTWREVQYSSGIMLSSI